MWFSQGSADAGATLPGVKKKVGGKAGDEGDEDCQQGGDRKM